MTTPAASQIDAVRRFNRFYTRQIGLLDERLLKSEFTLAEMRVLYEIANRPQTTARELISELGLDAGYLSRMLKKFSARGLIASVRSPSDGRVFIIRMTDQGHSTFAPFEQASAREVAELLEPIADRERGSLLASMQVIEEVLGRRDPETKEEFSVRTHLPGDIGWVISRHAELYSKEYGWDGTFEAMVAEIAAGFIRTFNPARERCWIAERQGHRVGSVFCVRQDDHVAKLRMLIVDPSARGFGIGERLVGECIAFARSAGYDQMTLWTNDILTAARRIYVRHGFELVEEERHQSFGKDLIGQNWRLKL